jgi:hypothetical protein
MKQQSFINRRVRPRIDVLLKANFEIKDKAHSENECLIANISTSGAGLVFSGLAEGSISKGLIITLGFFIPGTDRHIYAQGEIIWTKQLEDTIAAGVNFFVPLSFEEIIKCCIKTKNKFEPN